MGQIFGCTNVKESTVTIREQLGGDKTELKPGCHCVPWCLCYGIDTRVSQRVQRFFAKIPVMSEDAFLVTVSVCVWYKVNIEHVKSFSQNITTVREQLRSVVSHVVQSTLANLNVDAMYQQNNSLKNRLMVYLEKVFEVQIVNVFISDVNAERKGVGENDIPLESELLIGSSYDQSQGGLEVSGSGYEGIDKRGVDVSSSSLESTDLVSIAHSLANVEYKILLLSTSNSTFCMQLNSALKAMKFQVGVHDLLSLKTQDTEDIEFLLLTLPVSIRKKDSPCIQNIGVDIAIIVIDSTTLWRKVLGEELSFCRRFKVQVVGVVDNTEGDSIAAEEVRGMGVRFLGKVPVDGRTCSERLQPITNEILVNYVMTKSG